MREILFRGKLESGAWVYGSLVQAPGFVGIIERDEERYDYPYMDSTTGCIDGNACIVDPDTVGQYTGLTDKNGTKIFEGDVVSGLFLYALPINGVVAFRDGAFGLCWMRGGWQEFTAFTSMCNVTHEVLGNVHDNPELMEVGYE